jgi:KDO2-lipid IV(A) lauroyltransferase
MRDTLVYLSYRMLGALVGPLPPRLGYALARRAGAMLPFLAPKLRRTVAHNLGHVLGAGAPAKQVKALVREVCVNIAKGHYELFRVSRFTKDQIRSRLKVEGLEHLATALGKGRGAIAFAAHLGNVEIALQLPPVFGIPITAVAQHTRPEKLFQYACKLRSSHGVRLIPSDRVVVDLFRALKRGELVLLATDRDVTENARTVDFFGSPARLPDGPVQVALRTGAAMVPASARRLDDDSFLLRFEPPLELQRTGDREADIAAGMAQVIAIMERNIAACPGQWTVAAPIWPMNSESPGSG